MGVCWPCVLHVILTPPESLEGSNFGFNSSTTENDSVVCSAGAIDASRVRGVMKTNIWTIPQRNGRHEARNDERARVFVWEVHTKRLNAKQHDS